MGDGRNDLHCVSHPDGLCKAVLFENKSIIGYFRWMQEVMTNVCLSVVCSSNAALLWQEALAKFFLEEKP
jgi:hypothetical protein